MRGILAETRENVPETSQYLWFLNRFGDFSFYFGGICQGGKKLQKGFVFDFINLI